MACKHKKKSIKAKYFSKLIRPMVNAHSLNLAVKFLQPDAAIHIINKVN